MKEKFKSRIFRVLISAVCVVLAMCISYAVSYKIIRNGVLSKTAESTPNVQDENFDSDKPFPNLPVTISGTYDENQDFASDTNDYLVISENNLVNLYSIDKDNKKTFEKILESDIASLKAEDRALLAQGIFLNYKASVLSLIEDYSS